MYIIYEDLHYYNIGNSLLLVQNSEVFYYVVLIVLFIVSAILFQFSKVTRWQKLKGQLEKRLW